MEHPEEQEQNVYSGSEARSTLVDNDEMDDWEEGFVQGYEAEAEREEKFTNDAYENAFKKRRRKKQEQPEDPFEEDEDYDVD